MTRYMKIDNSAVKMIVTFPNKVAFCFKVTNRGLELELWTNISSMFLLIRASASNANNTEGVYRLVSAVVSQDQYRHTP